MRAVAEVLELPGFYCISSVLPQYSTIHCISRALSHSEYLAIYTRIVLHHWTRVSAAKALASGIALGSGG